MRTFLAIIFSLITISLSAQEYEQTCYFGFGFEVSQNSRWGFGEPVITRVDPYSNAEKAGLKAGDIIMEVNGMATYLRHYSLISSWIFENTTHDTYLTIRNLNNTFKEIKLNRYCRNVHAITEDELADWYSLYSVEGNSKRHFSMPLRISASPKVDFSDYYTFDFIFKNKKTTEIDDYICHQIEKTLTKKHLTRDVKNPDILIQIYYSYEPNKHYNSNVTLEDKFGESRYDMDLKRMVNVPVVSVKDGEELPVYVKGKVNFGFQFFEKKYINPGKMTQIWDAEMTEYIIDGSLESYCQLHVPLMIAAYPYQAPTKALNYSVDFKEYNYTGVLYNRDDLSLVDAVDEGSPAQKAGLRYGDRILSVNSISFPQEGMNAKKMYGDFVAKAMTYRDMNDGFYNDKVQDRSYPWLPDEYEKIRKEFHKKDYAAGFAYLFSFENFVESKPSTELNFKVLRQGQVLKFKINAEKRKSALLEYRK